MKRQALFIITFLLVFLIIQAIPVFAVNEVKYIIDGHGWGHGVGMCQYGAKGQADSGKDYQLILKHYYTGVEIKAASVPSTVKIGIGFSSGKLKLGQSGKFSIYEDEAKTKLIQKDTTGFWEVKLESGKLVLYTPSGSKKGAYSSTIFFDNQSTIFELQKYYSTSYQKFHQYRGDFLIRIENNYLKPVNIVKFEEYLYGLTEVSTSWPAEAQKAQAVAARSYIMANIGKHTSYDLCDATHCQVYTGYDREISYLGSNWVNAVKNTNAQVIYYSSKPVAAYYSSTCGGKTENNENVWGGSPLGYLRGVTCNYCQSSPSYSWSLTKTTSELETKLGSLVKGKLLDLKVIKTGYSPRVIIMRIFGTSGNSDISGSTFKSKLGLKETWFGFKRIEPAIYPRLKGNDIYETNVKISQHGWPSGTTKIILTRSDNFPDAVCGQSLAAKYSAPVLLTETDVLPDVIRDEIDRLKPSDVYIIGGTTSVSTNIENSLVAKKYKVKRIAGISSRYETSAEVAYEFGSSSEKAVFLVSGEDYGDGLIVSSTVARSKIPVLLSKENSIPQEAFQALSKLGIKRIFTIGNNLSLSSQQVNWLKRRGFVVKNVADTNDLYEKDLLLQKCPLFSGTINKMYIADGQTFQDGVMTASLLTRFANSDLIYVKPDSIPQPSAEILTKEKKNIKSVYIIGGENSVSYETEYAINQKLK